MPIGYKGTLEQRFWRKVGKTDDCWYWIAAKSPKGYGNLWNGNRVEHAHRVAYKLFIGPIPDGLFVCHTCDEPSCVNPAHLFLGTNEDNQRDASRKGRTAAGTKHPNSKLTSEQVIEMRTLYATGEFTLQQLAEAYKICNSTAYYAIHKINYEKD